MCTTALIWVRIRNQHATNVPQFWSTLQKYPFLMMALLITMIIWWKWCRNVMTMFYFILLVIMITMKMFNVLQGLWAEPGACAAGSAEAGRLQSRRAHHGRGGKYSSIHNTMCTISCHHIQYDTRQAQERNDHTIPCCIIPEPWVSYHISYKTSQPLERWENSVFSISFWKSLHSSKWFTKLHPALSQNGRP